MDKIRPYIVTILVILALIGLDLVLKIIVPKEEIVLIPNVIKITYTQNTGGAFSIGSGNIGPLIAITFIIITFAIRFLVTHIKTANKITIFSLCLIIAGGIGNLLNRIFMGYVIDYINIEDLFKFPVFNLADIYIVLGWIAFVIITITYSFKNKK